MADASTPNVERENAPKLTNILATAINEICDAIRTIKTAAGVVTIDDDADLIGEIWSSAMGVHRELSTLLVDSLHAGEDGTPSPDAGEVLSSLAPLPPKPTTNPYHAALAPLTKLRTACTSGEFFERLMEIHGIRENLWDLEYQFSAIEKALNEMGLAAIQAAPHSRPRIGEPADRTAEMQMYELLTGIWERVKDDGISEMRPEFLEQEGVIDALGAAGEKLYNAIKKHREQRRRARAVMDSKLGKAR